MADKVLELVVYTLKPGVTEEDFLEKSDATSRWLEHQEGFISRDLVKPKDDERWIDVVWWESHETAQAALAQAETTPEVLPFLEAMDLESAIMLHGDPVGVPVVRQA